MEVLDEFAAQNPPFYKEHVEKLKKDYYLRHWYELGLEILSFLNLEGIAGERMRIYNSFITLVEMRLDIMHRTSIFQLVSEDITSPSAAIEFLSKSIEKVTEKTNAVYLLRLQIVHNHIIDGNFESSLSILMDIETSMDHQTDISVKSLYYKCLASLDKARSDFDAFYQHALLYLSISREQDDLCLAYDLCACSLCAKSVFSFAEVARHPVIKKLRGTENAWLLSLVCLMDSGHPDSITDYLENYLPILKSKPRFAPYTDFITTKLRLCVLQEMIFQKPFESRIFDFDSVSRMCLVEEKYVEILVLKALAGGMIRGYIDEVEKKFVVTWCKPKTLSTTRISHLKEQIDRWRERVHEQRILMEIKAQPVIG